MNDMKRDTPRSKKNEVFQRKGSKQKRKKQVRAKIWNPRFPGEKTSTDEESINLEKQSKMPKRNDSQTDTYFEAEQYAQQNIIGQSYYPSSTTLETVYPVSEQNILQRQERETDISPPNGLQEHNLPPVASLIGCNQQNSQAQSTSFSDRPTEYNFSAFDSSFSTSTRNYTNSEALDRILWNENDTMSFMSQVQPTTTSFC